MDHSDEYKKLPNSIGRLIHLRYLKIESNAIIYLPDSITRLVNLQTLNLESCEVLEELPSDFAKLVNLRHLLLPYEKLTDLPPGFGKLPSLQLLNMFIVGKGNGIDSLGAWNYKGELKIEFRGWRRDAIDEVKRANLKNNHQLTTLTLDLEEEEEKSTPAAGNMNEMLRCLQLPPNLKILRVWCYKGDKMAVRWFDGLSELVSIQIFDCRECKVLPDFSWLPRLKFLALDELDELEYVEDEDEDNMRVGAASATHNNRCFFPSLQFLDIISCKKLKGWRRALKNDGDRHQLVFPRLLKMYVHKCPMLMYMPLAPKLESLNVYNTNWKMVESIVRPNDSEEAAASSSSAPPSTSTVSTSLKELKIIGVNDELITLSISSSCILRIEECSELRKLRFEFPNSIRELIIKRCSRLKNISEGLQHLSVLENLRIWNCEELEMEEEEEGKSSRGWQGLSSLRQLRLERIPKVKTLPRGIACLTTLQQLRLEFMDNLTELPEEIGNLSLLCVLWIVGCPKVKSLPPSILGLPMLQELHLDNMENLTELPAGEIIGNGNFPLLRVLDIRECPKMKSLPTSIQSLASLQTLFIVNCPDVAKKNMPDGQD